MTTTPTVWLDRSAPNYTLNGPGGNDQTGGRGIGLSNGNFLVIWETNIFQDPDGTNRTEIWGEIFDPRGVSISGEIQLAGLPGGAFIDFEKAEIDADDSGGFHMIFVSDPTAAPGGETVFVAQFDDAGTQTSLTSRSAFFVNIWGYPITDTEDVAITVTADGNVNVSMVLEHDPTTDAPFYPVHTLTPDGTTYALVFDSTNNGYGITFDVSSFPVNTREIEGLNYEALQSDAFRGEGNTRSVVTAELSNLGEDPYPFTGIMYYNNQDIPSASTQPEPRFIVDTSANPDTIADPDVATLDNDPAAPNGSQLGKFSYAVVYRRDAFDGSFSDIRAVIRNDLTGYENSFTIKQSTTGELSKPQITHLNGGGFMVAWIDEYAPDQREVRLQRFDGDGNAIGNELTFDNPQGRYIWDFDLETMANGRVLLTVSEGTDNRGVAYAIYNVDGNHITGTDADETLTANTGDSILEGLGGDDTLIGLDGDDWMSGGTGTDSFDGGGGNDTVDFTYSNSDWIVNLLTGTAVAGSTVETVTDIENVNTGGGDDTITAGNGINILKGNGGDDTIISGQGADDIDGGSGSDWADYRTEWTGLALAPFGNRTYDLVAGEMRWENVTGAGTGGYTERMANIENVKGSSYNDTFIANFLPNDLIGYGGDDNFISSDVGITIDFLADTYNGGTGIDMADFSAIAVDDGDTTASRSFTFVLSSIVPAAPAGTVTENGGGLVAQLFGIENLRGTGYDDSIDGNDGANTLNGGGGKDILRGLGGVDDLRGGDGNDILSGGAGVDIFDGGNGSDTVDYSTTAGNATYDLAQQKFLGAITENWTSIENVIAGAGNDTLIGSTGANLLNGGAGNDTFVLDNATDRVVEAAGGGVDQVTVAFSYTLAADAEVESLLVSNIGSTTALNLTGNLFAQTIAGNSGKNILSDGGTGGAADTLRGYGGNDTYRVNNSLAMVDETAGNGIDTIRTTVSYTLASGAEVENLFALSPLGNKPINLVGNGFAQTIIGNAAINVLLGLDGNDTLAGLGGRDVIDGGDGVDTLDYSESDAAVRLAFNNGNAIGGHGEGDAISNIENIKGSDFDDIFTGNNGANTLDGGDGNDTLNGGSGKDQLTGGRGGDTFVFLSVNHSGVGETVRDSITDFATGDVIDLSAIDAQESSSSTNEAFTFIRDTTFSGEGQVRVSQVGADTIVHVNTSGNSGTEMQIVLLGFTAADLSAADFLL